MKLIFSKPLLFVALFVLPLFYSAQETGLSIIKKVDKNMYSKTQIVELGMTVYGKRNIRTITSKSYGQGKKKYFTEYLSPDREKGTKMLKLENRLWIYSPRTDRIVQLSGHLLKQSLMGSDISYEDVMEIRKLEDLYNVKELTNETLNEKEVWKLELIAKVSNANYFKKVMWVDKKTFVPLREELFAKSGELLKRIIYSNIKKIGNRWYPEKINYKDVLKKGKGTDLFITNIKFDVPVPEYLFNKAALKK